LATAIARLAANAAMIALVPPPALTAASAQLVIQERQDKDPIAKPLP
jgi:hypothetical protein